MILIGVAGRIASGKDVVASFLARQHGFTIHRFSDALKKEILRTLPRTLRAYAQERGVPEDDLDRAIHAMIYTERTPVTRALLQEWGTDLRRRENPNYWIDKLRQVLIDARAEDRIVIPDVRFPNEYETILEFGGHVLYIYRPGTPIDTHESETSLSGHSFENVLVNDGSIEDLERKVDTWLREKQILR